MAKAIKFNLTLDKQPVRDKDDLLSNFNIDDLLKLFKEGLLSRWLEVRGLSKELTALEKINKGEGSLGLLVNDQKLYTDLENAARNLNLLIEDLKANPKKYLKISVF